VETHTKPLVRTLWAFAVETSRELGPLPSSSRARRRLRPKRSLYDFMDETTDLEKIAEQAKEPIAGAAQDLKETASSIADAARPAAEAAWKDTKSELSRLNSICEGYVKEKPFQTLLVVLGIGILVGLVMRR
jgi:ElaB/YqjD/DUF883 family membrane-anchored ribosome-binding protein